MKQLIYWLAFLGFGTSTYAHLDLQIKVTLNKSFALQVTLPTTIHLRQTLEFHLHKKLMPVTTYSGVSITPCKAVLAISSINCWYLTTYGKGSHQFEIQLATSQKLPLQMGEGVIDLNKGIVLYGSNYWYPVIPNTINRISFQIDGPNHWSFITPPNHLPMETAYLFGGPFAIYQDNQDGINYQVYLNQKDTALADQYLKLMPALLNAYVEQIGPFPYKEFRVVENIFNETGYGLPAATLLGSQVIRLPFIFTSSLPHEILHNWWGNGVYIDDQYGNWSEGLTTYQSDYLFASQKGQAKLYRMNQLLKYQDYHLRYPEIPLTEFRFRHNDASQALGYGKSMMLFHMLKQRIGVDNFNQGLKDFYKKYLFRKAHFFDLQQTFQNLGQDSQLRSWFNDWLFKTGQPELKVRNLRQQIDQNSHFKIEFDIDQVQNLHQFQFELPIEFRFDDLSSQIKWVRVENKPTTKMIFTFSKKVICLQIDPSFEVFRKIGNLERPAQLLSAFSSSELLINNQLPSEFDLKFAEIIRSRFSQLKSWQPITNTSVQYIPAENLIILGKSAESLSFISSKIDQHKGDLIINSNEIYFLNSRSEWQKFDNTKQDLVITIKNKSNPAKNIVWIIPSEPNQITVSNFQSFIGRLTHYASSSLLVLEGRKSIINKTWDSLESELLIRFNP